MHSIYLKKKLSLLPKCNKPLLSCCSHLLPREASWIYSLALSFVFFCFVFFFNFILFLNLKHCISFAKHQNESATGIHVSFEFTFIPLPTSLWFPLTPITRLKGLLPGSSLNSYLSFAPSQSLFYLTTLQQLIIIMMLFSLNQLFCCFPLFFILSL